MSYIKRTAFAAFCATAALVLTPDATSVQAVCNQKMEQTVTIQKVDNTCGNQATWSFDEKTGTLTISGKGEVKYCAQWNKLKPKKLVIKEGITSVDSFTFSGMKTIKEISLPKSLRTLDYYCFSRVGVERITIPETIKYIGSDAFSNCYQLKEVVYRGPSDAGFCFEGCTNLEKVTYDSKEVAAYMFYCCKNLKQIKFEQPIKCIRSGAFTRTGLTTFRIPESVTKVGSGAFEGCGKLKQMTFTKGMKVIPAGILGTNGKNIKIVIEEGVTHIAKKAFENLAVEEVKIPSTVVDIGCRAFAKTKIKKVQLPDKVKLIRKNVFYHCRNLEQVKLGKKVWRIGESAFEGCTSLKSVSIPSRTRTVGYRAFYGSGLEKVSLGKGVKFVEYWAFQNCRHLKNVNIGSTAKMIRNNAFADCPRLKTIQVNKKNPYFSTKNGVLYNKSQTSLLSCPAGKAGTFMIEKKVKTLNKYSFYGCRKLKAFKVEQGNRSFSEKDGMLYNARKNELVGVPIGKQGVIKVPYGVTKIGDYAFQNSKAKRITLPGSLKTIGFCAFEYCNQIKSITIPASVKTISEGAFWECEKLRSVEVQYGVKKIQHDAFYQCKKLSAIKIPASVTSISVNAFSDCYGGVTIYCKKDSYAETYAQDNDIRSKYI